MSAKILKTDGALALIELETAESPCNGCKSPCGQGVCKKAASVRVWADNRIGAAVGDTVETDTKSGLGSLVYMLGLFIFPLACGFAAYLAADALGASEALAIIAAVGGFAAVISVATLIINAHARKHPGVIITGKSKE